MEPSKKRLARARRLASAGPQSGSRRRHGWERTNADNGLLSFISRHGLITLRQATQYFYGGVAETARERVRKLAEAGLVQRRTDIPWAGTLIIPTLDGQTIGLGSISHPLRTTLSIPGYLEHKLAVIDHALAAQSRGVWVISEREIRMLEARKAPAATDYLRNAGAQASLDGVARGIVPSTLTVLRVEPEDRGGGVQHLGERAAWLGVPIRGDLDEKLAPFSPEQRSQLRYPDFIEITEAGELVAVEVEISPKAQKKLRAIVCGYRDALAYIEPADVSPMGERRLRYRQFRYVRWFCTPEVAAMLQGTHNPKTGKHTPGILQQEMPDVFGENYDWDKQDPRRPVSVHLVTADDPGVQYALDQRVLFPPYRCDYRAWQRRQDEWKSMVSEEKRGLYTYARWIRAKGILRHCRSFVDM